MAFTDDSGIPFVGRGGSCWAFDETGYELVLAATVGVIGSTVPLKERRIKYRRSELYQPTMPKPDQL